MQTITYEKLERAKDILKQWQTADLKETMPDVKEITIEALQCYIQEMEGQLKMADDYEKTEELREKERLADSEPEHQEDMKAEELREIDRIIQMENILGHG